MITYNNRAKRVAGPQVGEILADLNLAVRSLPDVNLDRLTLNCEDYEADCHKNSPIVDSPAVRGKFQ